MTEMIFTDASFGYHQQAVLQQISFMVNPGEIVAVVGPNGVGKSTLIKAASGVLPLISGSVTVSGVNIHKMSAPERARLIAVVPQAVKLPGAFNALDVVKMGRTPYLGWLEPENELDHEISLQAMQRTGTEAFTSRLVGELSGGEQQRVLIARALAQSADIMLLDEPTAHLDLRHQDNVLRLVRHLAQDDGLAILISLHDLNLVARYTDRVVLLSDSHIFSHGLPEDVLTPRDLAHVYGVQITVMPHPLDGKPLVLPGGGL